MIEICNKVFDYLVSIKNWLYKNYKAVIVCIGFVLAFAALAWANSRIDKLLKENAELKKAVILNKEQVTDSNFMQNKLHMNKQNAQAAIDKIEKAQNGDIKPVSSLTVEAENEQQAAELVKEKIDSKDPFLPKEALSDSDRTLVVPQYYNKDYKVGVYKVNNYRNWGIGTGIGRLGSETYIPLVVHRQYHRSRSLDLQINYSTSKSNIDGFQVVHMWHF